ncbi:MAG: alpha-glucan family phosphorylase [Bacteroidales bacterium]|nr:alpha-glucan family phosphorylase [Bacteroidales bacterium]
MKIHYLFEVSWEVCNKVGGINTVISTKAQELLSHLEGTYFAIGPDIAGKSLDRSIFVEDNNLFRAWHEQLQADGFQCKIGRWNIPGNPIAILVNFSRLYTQKDEILYELWTEHGLDSLAGGWDYIEPVLFGYEAGKLIEHFYKYFVSAEERLVVQIHEWLTGSTLLYLKKAVPQACTVFTTHATVMGRSMAGNKQPLYALLDAVKSDEKSKELHIEAKFNLEKLSAQTADVFTTVSEITSHECKYFLQKKPDFITPNGFNSDQIHSLDDLDKKRKNVRALLPRFVGAVTGKKVSDHAFYILTSGRYEFHNKGLDLFIDALAELRQELKSNDEVVAIIAVPAHQAGPNIQILKNYQNSFLAQIPHYATHYLFDENNDPIIQKLKYHQINNNPEDPLQVIFIPSYLDGQDGLLNIPYYELLSGMDLTAFPSYYEPWGYTPMESIAYGIPTITTSLAGFGSWILKNHPNQTAVTVLNRNDYNYDEVKNLLANKILEYLNSSEEKRQNDRLKAIEIAKECSWKNFITHYLTAYETGLKLVLQRSENFKTKIPLPLQQIKTSFQEPIWRKILIKPKYPPQLEPLLELMRNLWWTWHPEVEEFFASIHPENWELSAHNPLKMLEMIPYQQLIQLTHDQNFMDELSQIYHRFKSYMEEGLDYSKPSVAYFCMEYGFHSSLKLYAGGLGILAGDYLKEASDQRLPLTGIGLLFRYGYFHQTLSHDGMQVNQYLPQKFSVLPLIPVRDKDGKWITIQLTFPGREIHAKVWKIQVGRVELFLLDTDLDENAPEDRSITYQLYGGDSEVRLKQEILLGIGGVMVLEKLGKKIDVYHINEGHAAFSILKRIEQAMQQYVLNFHQALELVRNNTLFTTHTPVPAGHDVFSQELLRIYFADYCEKLNINWQDFVSLGLIGPYNKDEKFSMSILALKGSVQTNGVSKIHGTVTREMFAPLYPGFFTDELFIQHITNAVHLPTWMDPMWQQLLQKKYINILELDMSDPDNWKIFNELNEDEIWNVRKQLKSRLVEKIKIRLSEELVRRQEAPRHIVEILNTISDNALWFGFARRFATYKRAHLILNNTERLKRLVSNSDRPVFFVFAGKAHPADVEGQKLIQNIIQISRMPEFRGKILFLENYDMELAHLLVSGVDVWVNTPTRPLEASGTSGMKAVMNGVLNLSVSDGWWAEGYKPKAGWALEEKRTYLDQRLQDELDAETLYEIIEDEIVPSFFYRNPNDIPCKWIGFIRNAFTRIAPYYVTKRMINEYLQKYYFPLMKRYHQLTEKDLELFLEWMKWKRKVEENFNEIYERKLELPDSTIKPLVLGEDFIAAIELYLADLSPRDIKVELIFGQKIHDRIDQFLFIEEMKPTSFKNNIARFEAVLSNKKAGVFDYAIRVTPYNDLMPHRQDFPLVKWF